MLASLINRSLHYRALVVAAALATLVAGGYVAGTLPIDVLPNLTRPRVVVICECPGMAPEEVETEVTLPLEYALNGATDVLDVRTTSDIGLAVLQVEFDWGQEIFRARQIVQERLATATGELPPGIQPQLAPVSSLLGQILLIGMWADDDATDAMELRTLAEWVVAPHLRSLPGVAQVIAMGGDRKQIHVLVDHHRMHQYDVSLGQIEQALRDANLNVTGGFVDDGAEEWLVRGIGRVADPETLGKVVIRPSARRPVLLEQVARVVEGPQAKRGDATVNGRPAVVLTVQKQPDADTRQLTDVLLRSLDELAVALPDGVTIRPTYQQRTFIDHGIANVVSAIGVGAGLVVIVLLLFLGNARTTLITVLAIPLSLVITALVFAAFGLGINVMTLGGLAVGLGMLVDDAIVGVENAYRRLRERLGEGQAGPPEIVEDATREVLGAILISTLIVVVVFAPLLTLAGLEGRLFTPLATAYLISIIASTVVALTVTPALALMLLPGSARRASPGQEPWLLAILKRLATPWIRGSLHPLGLGVAGVLAIVGVALAAAMSQRLERDFLPAFDEGATQVNLYSAPGTSLASMTEIASMADQRLTALLRDEDRPDAPLDAITCKIGRAEQDEHIMGVHVAEYVITPNEQAAIPRGEMIDLLADAVSDIPGVQFEIEQPIAHLISHMLSGVSAHIAIKLHGDDLDLLRRQADRVRLAIRDVPGIDDPVVEQQQIVPQLRFELDYDALARFGLAAREVTDLIETAMHGRVVSRWYQGQRFFEILVRMDDEYRTHLETLERLPVETPGGARLLLGDLVRIERGGGPNAIHRENARRRIVVRVNARGGDVGRIVDQIRRRVAESVPLPPGYFVSYGGQFEARRSAQRQLLWFALASTLMVFAVLYSAFPSTRIVLQILGAVPIAFVGGVFALAITGQSLSIAAMVGFVSLGGIATRNGLLLISTYRHLGDRLGINPETIVRGSLERLSPVLMSALTTSLGLLPLVIGGSQPGKEMLYPVATVIVGGLATSTLAELLIRPGLYWLTYRPDRD